jgi:uncharacterized protein (DUF4415 family)
MTTMASDDTRRYSVDELEDKVAKGDYVPTRKDAPEVELNEDFWANARVVMPPGKKSVHLRVDADVLEWFRAHGKGYLTRMNAVLRSYMDAHKHDRG